MQRTASVQRTTRETSIRLQLDLDGTGKNSISTGIGFFNHMLELFAAHGLFDLDLEAHGDLEVDCHHTVEDTGLALGQAFHEALGDKSGLRRYGTFYLPMDEALVRVVLDCSGRPFLRFVAPTGLEPIGVFPFQLVEEFLRAFAMQSRVTLHVDVLAGKDSHHVAEAVFKGLARALDAATQRDPRVTGIPSTKGTL